MSADQGPAAGLVTAGTPEGGWAGRPQWRPAGLNGALRLAVAAASHAGLGRAWAGTTAPADGEVTGPVIGPVQQAWPAGGRALSNRGAGRPPSHAAARWPATGRSGRLPSPVIAGQAQPGQAPWADRLPAPAPVTSALTSGGPSGAAAPSGGQAGVSRLIPFQPASRPGWRPGDPPGVPEPSPLGPQPGRSDFRWPTPVPMPTSAAVVRPDEAVRLAGEIAWDLVGGRRTPELAQPAAARLGGGLVDAVSGPMALPGLVVRPVPADGGPDSGLRADDGPRAGNGRLPGQSVAPIGSLAKPAAPPRPDEQDRPWPAQHRAERPASAAARGPDIDTIAERVIGRLRRQQRLDRERRG